MDSAGEIDVATIEIDQKALPPNVTLQAFIPEHPLAEHDSIEVGSPAPKEEAKMAWLIDRPVEQSVVEAKREADDERLRFQG